ncbi:MAG: DUF302 domain-containing protein [Fimbriimonadaceae bacterium]
MTNQPRPEIGAVSRYGFAETCARLQEAAQAMGFSVLGVHAVSETLASKGFESIPVTVIEVCKAPMAALALRNDPRVATMMPCPVAVVEDGSSVRVYTIDARQMAALFEGPDLAELGLRMHEELERLIQTVA